MGTSWSRSSIVLGEFWRKKLEENLKKERPVKVKRRIGGQGKAMGLKPFE